MCVLGIDVQKVNVRDVRAVRHEAVEHTIILGHVLQKQVFCISHEADDAACRVSTVLRDRLAAHVPLVCGLIVHNVLNGMRKGIGDAGVTVYEWNWYSKHICERIYLGAMTAHLRDPRRFIA